MKCRNVLEGIGAALLLLYSYYLEFFHPSNHAIYHHNLPVTNLIGGVLVDLFVVAVLTAGLLAANQYLRPPLQNIVEAVYVGTILWSVVDLVIQVLLDMWVRISSWQYIWEHSFVVIPLSLVALAYFLPRHAQPVMRSVRLAIAACAFSALWIVPHLIRVALARPLGPSSAPPSLSGSGRGEPGRRIVWMLFDELSYDQTFEHPAPGIRLPNFNRLRAASISFSSLTPAGYYTDRIIPSLILGHRFDAYRSTLDGKLSYWDKSHGSWVDYDPRATLFAEAQQNGWETGVDGWYNPYCRILSSFLTTCNWYPGSRFPMEEYGASEDKSALPNALALFNQLLAVLTHQTITDSDIQIMAYRNFMAHSQALIDDNHIRFVYLHLPVPHPPGFFDRQRHVLRSGGTYLDNLVLADDTLGALMKEIDASPSASQTTVIVTSDHSWRVPLYRPNKGWSAEEERASGGKFDDRPVLLVHFPGQQGGWDVPASYSEMLEHDLISGMLNGRIEHPEDLSGFLAQYGR